jgi:hypothetical protein
MKKFIIAMFVLTSSMVSAQAPVDPWSVASIALSVGQWISKDSKKVYYVQVEATGSNSQVAQDAARRKAVELAVGTVVLGESESDGSRLKRNEIITYSAGMIEDYKILSEVQVGNRTRVTMDVWVSDSKIANRLLSMGQSQGAAVNGDQIKRDWEKDQSKKKADEDGMTMTRRVLDDYPRMAWSTRVVGTQVTRNNTGALVLEINVEFKFSEKYLEALEECIQRTRYSSWNSSNGKSGVRVYTGRFSNTAGTWQDSSVQSMWEHAFNRPFSLEVRVVGDSRPLVWNDVQNNLKDFTGYLATGDGTGRYNSSFFVVDGGHSQRIKFHVTKRPEHSEERFINWISTLTKVEARVVDNRI